MSEFSWLRNNSRVQFVFISYERRIISLGCRVAYCLQLSTDRNVNIGKKEGLSSNKLCVFIKEFICYVFL